MDIALGTATHDLAIAGRDIRLTSGAEQVAQRMKIRLLLFRGEWFLDVRAGIPYYQQVLRKGIDVNAIASLFRRALRTVPGVTDLLEFSLDYDAPTRRLSVSARASTPFGPADLEVSL